MNPFHESPHTFVTGVHLHVTDLEKSIRFYETVIGLQASSRSGSTAVLTADGKTPLVTLEQPEGIQPKQGRTAGLYHFALLLPGRRDLSLFLRHLLNTGYPFGAADHYVSEAIYIDDPDGNGIEVYRDRPSSEWVWKNGLVEMATVQLDGDSLLAEADQPFTGLSAGAVMGHLHLHVPDLKEAENFYVNGLGFQIVSHYPQALFASTGSYHHHIALNTWQGAGGPLRPPNSAGLHSFTLLFPSEQARETAVENLAQQGITVTGYETVDPSGSRIQLTV